MQLLDYTVLNKVLAFAFFTTITPGLNNILMFLFTLHFGVWQAVQFRLGVLVGFPTMAFLVVLGLAPIMQTNPQIVWGLEMLGVGLLLYLAYKIFTSKPTLSQNAKRYGFGTGIILQLANGKAWSMAFVATTVYTNPETPVMTQATTIWFAFLVTNILCSIPWILAPYMLKEFLYNDRNMRIINYIFGTIIVYMAIGPYLF